MPIEIVMIVVASMVFTLILIQMLANLKKNADGPNIQQEEFEALKERVRVLERITVEEGNSLAAEIAALEDRSGPSLDEVSRAKSADRI